jgi:hypothetical protein
VYFRRIRWPHPSVPDEPIGAAIDGFRFLIDQRVSGSMPMAEQTPTFWPG